MFKSPKTTTLGICAIVSALVAAATAWANGTAIDYGSLISAVAAGLAAIFARDNAVTSEQAGAK